MYTRSFTSLYASGTAETNNIVKNLYFHKNFKIKKKIIIMQVLRREVARKSLTGDNHV